MIISRMYLPGMGYPGLPKKRESTHQTSPSEGGKGENALAGLHTSLPHWLKFASVQYHPPCRQVASFGSFSCLLRCHKPSPVVWCYIEIFRWLPESELLMSLPGCFVVAMKKVPAFMVLVTVSPRKGAWTGTHLGCHGRCLRFLEVKLIHLFCVDSRFFHSCTSRADNDP